MNKSERGSLARREAFNRALKRVEYRLTFNKMPQPRQWSEGELHGPGLPDAHREDRIQAGEWRQHPPLTMAMESESDWLAHFLSMAVNEAVHEALEYFRVDGRPYLDPHGGQEEWIYVIVNEFAAQLAELAERERPPG